MPWHCKKCDSEDIEVQDWVNPNTGQASEHDDVNTDSTWCKHCQGSELGIVWKDEPPSELEGFLKEHVKIIHITDND
jgi:hypothetical protein